MSTGTAEQYRDGRGLMVLWATVLSGPAAWAINQLIGYALVKPACSADARFLLGAVAAGTFVLTVAGGWKAWALLRMLRGAKPGGGRQEDRNHLLAAAGVTLNALLGLLILTHAVSIFLLSPCE